MPDIRCLLESGASLFARADEVIGSAYYHWSPNTDTLFWDRPPMALTFMAILAVAVEERVSIKTGTILLWPLLALAVFNLLHAVYRSRKPTRNRCWPRPISKSRSLIPTVDRWPRAGAAQGSSGTMFKSRWKPGTSHHCARCENSGSDRRNLQTCRSSSFRFPHDERR